MYCKVLICLGVLVFLPLSSILGAEVIINEVAWMGSLPKPGETNVAASNNEWMELANLSLLPVNIDGWTLIAEDGTPSINLSGTITASGFFLLERTNDDTVLQILADLIYSGALSNSGERLVLKDRNGNIVDEVNASLAWPAGDNNTKDTMQRQGYLWVSASSTPRAANFKQMPQNATPPPISPQPSPAPPTLYFLDSYPSIKAYAGEDKSVLAGSLVEFVGKALGLNGDPLENARFLWNFGDGQVQDGKMLRHVFPIPGKYIVGLHVSSGTNAASDYLEVEVLPNQVIIQDVVGGEPGFIRVENRSVIEIDLGEWVIEDPNGKRFIIPTRTKIGPHRSAAFSNKITGLLKDGVSGNITINYPNNTVALVWENKSIGKVLGITSTILEERSSPQNTIAAKKVLSENNRVAEKRRGSEVYTASAHQAKPNNSKLFFIVAVIFSLIVSLIFLATRIFLH